VKLFAITCGRLTGDVGYLMEGGEGRADLPIPAYLIEHPKGTALFDTGMTMLASLDKLARLEAAGSRIFFGHDGEFWKGVPQAPAAIS
jgi:N-acyl homoserine lactone hydrolase